MTTKEGHEPQTVELKQATEEEDEVDLNEESGH